MNYRLLGKTGLSVSEIGLGTWVMGKSVTLGGVQIGWRNVYDKSSIRTILSCLDLGINFIDTADTYGKGHSEELIGKAIKEKREKYIIATKCGNYEDEYGHWSQSWHPEYITRSCENSLKRLKTDYIDLYQVHTPMPEKSIFGFNEETFDVFRKLKKQGKILHYGYSSFGIKDAFEVVQKNLCEVIQIPYNLLEREQEKKLFKVALEKNVGVIIRKSLASGFLSGKFKNNTIFPKSDHRSRLSREKISFLASKAREFIPIAESKKGRSLSQFSIQFCLNDDAVSVVITGARNVKQLKENTEAHKYGKLTKSEISAINRIITI